MNESDVRPYLETSSYNIVLLCMLFSPTFSNIVSLGIRLICGESLNKTNESFALVIGLVIFFILPN